MLVSGQHIAKAVVTVADELRAQHLPVPDSLLTVNAMVLLRPLPVFGCMVFGTCRKTLRGCCLSFRMPDPSLL